MLDTIIHDAILVTMAGDGLGLVVGGALGIEGGRIVCVGETGAVRGEHKARRYVDGTGKIVMPGLINAHTHSFGTLNRGILAETEAYLEEGMVGYMDAWTADSLRASIRLHVLEGLKRGITTFCDNTIMLGDTAHVYADMGVRARLSPMTREMSWDYQANLNGDYEFDRSYAHREFDDTIRLLERYGADPNERVSIIVGFQALDYVTRELAIECRELARKNASMLAVHLAQSDYEIEQCERRYGKRPLAVLDELDLLNGRTIAAHMALNTPEENAIAARSGLNLAFCPSVWGQIGMSPPAAEYLDMGGVVGLGTDETTFGSINMFTELKTGCITATTRALGAGVPPLTASKMLRIATMGSAKAVGIDSLVGSLEPGKRADVIVLDATRVNLCPMLTAPMRNVAQNLVYATTGDEVETVFVDGEMVVENGKALTVDENVVLRDAQTWAQAMSESAYTYFKNLEHSSILEHLDQY